MDHYPGAAQLLREAALEAQEHPPGTPSQDEVDAFTSMLDDYMDMGVSLNLDNIDDDTFTDAFVDTAQLGAATSMSEPQNIADTSAVSRAPMAGIVKEVTGALVAPRTRQSYIK